MFTANLFHLSSPQYLLIAMKGRLNHFTLMFSHSQYLVRVKERSMSWVNIDKINSDLKFVTQSVQFINL